MSDDYLNHAVGEDCFGDEIIVPDPYTYSLFKESSKPVVHLAQRIFLECVHWEVPVPPDVMKVIIDETHKQVEKYDSDHPDWHIKRLGKTPEQVFRFPEITKALEEAAVNGDSKASVFRRFTEGESNDGETSPWRLLKKRYTDYMKKVKRLI